MRKFILLLALTLMLGLTFQNSIEAQELPGHKVSTKDEIAAVKSSTVVTGLVYGPKITNSAIVADRILWEGKSYTYDLKTGKILIRTKDEEKRWKGAVHNRAPKLTLVKVDKKGAHLKYQSTWYEKPVSFTKPLKKRSRR